MQTIYFDDISSIETSISILMSELHAHVLIHIENMKGKFI